MLSDASSSFCSSTANNDQSQLGVEGDANDIAAKLWITPAHRDAAVDASTFWATVLRKERAGCVIHCISSQRVQRNSFEIINGVDMF